jgi:TolA-binding protein
LGNAQFVGKDYKGAMATFQKLLSQDSKYVRVPEALLAIANCQLELKDNAGARKTLENLIAEHPRTEAADAAKDRVSRLK